MTWSPTTPGTSQSKRASAFPLQLISLTEHTRPRLTATIPQSYWWNEFPQKKYMSIISAFRGLSQEDYHEFKVNQGCKASSTNLGYIY